MTKYQFEVWINSIVQATEYEEMTRALALRYIADKPMDIISKLCNVTQPALVRAHNLVSKHTVIHMDKTMKPYDYTTVYAAHSLNIEEIRQILIDNKFDYLPLDARVYEAIQVEDMTWDDAKHTFNMSIPLLRRKLSDAIYRYFEKYNRPQPVFTQYPSYESITAEDMLKLASLNTSNRLIMTEYIKNGKSIEDISEQVRISVSTLDRVITMTMSYVAETMKCRGLRLRSDTNNNNLRGGCKATPFYYKCSTGIVSA